MSESLVQMVSNLPIEQVKDLADRAAKESFEAGTKLGAAISDLIEDIFD